jgi:hypothetical protein
MRQWLVQRAIGKPFEWQQYGEATQRFAAMGISSEAYIKNKALPGAEDLAASFKKPLVDAAMAIMQGTYGNFSRLIRSFGMRPEMAIRYGATPGKTGKGLSAATPEEQERNLEAILAMIQDRMGGTADAMSNTMSGLVSDMKDMWNSVAVMFADTPAFEFIKGVLFAIRQTFLMYRDQGVLKGWMDKLSNIILLSKPLVEAILPRLGYWLDNLVTWFSNLATWTATWLTEHGGPEAIVSLIDGVIWRIEVFGDTLYTMVAENLGGIINFLLARFQIAVATLQLIGAAFLSFMHFVSGIVNWLSGLPGIRETEFGKALNEWTAATSEFSKQAEEDLAKLNPHLNQFRKQIGALREETLATLEGRGGGGAAPRWAAAGIPGRLGTPKEQVSPEDLQGDVGDEENPLGTPGQGGEAATLPAKRESAALASDEAGSQEKVTQQYERQETLMERIGQARDRVRGNRGAMTGTVTDTGGGGGGGRGSWLSGATFEEGVRGGFASVTQNLQVARNRFKYVRDDVTGLRWIFPENASPDEMIAVMMGSAFGQHQKPLSSVNQAAWEYFDRPLPGMEQSGLDAAKSMADRDRRPAQGSAFEREYYRARGFLHGNTVLPYTMNAGRRAYQIGGGGAGWGQRPGRSLGIGDPFAAMMGALGVQPAEVDRSGWGKFDAYAQTPSGEITREQAAAIQGETKTGGVPSSSAAIRGNVQEGLGITVLGIMTALAVRLLWEVKSLDALIKRMEAEGIDDVMVRLYYNRKEATAFVRSTIARMMHWLKGLWATRLGFAGRYKAGFRGLSGAPENVGVAWGLGRGVGAAGRWLKNLKVVRYGGKILGAIGLGLSAYGVGHGVGGGARAEYERQRAGMGSLPWGEAWGHVGEAASGGAGVGGAMGGMAAGPVGAAIGTAVGAGVGAAAAGVGQMIGAGVGYFSQPDVPAPAVGPQSGVGWGSTGVKIARLHDGNLQINVQQNQVQQQEKYASNPAFSSVTGNA